MQIKLVMRWRHAVIIPADSKETDRAKRRRGRGGRGPLPRSPWGCAVAQLLWETFWRCLRCRLCTCLVIQPLRSWVFIQEKHERAQADTGARNV